MNQYDVEEAAERWFSPEETPNLHEGAQILLRLLRWTNSHSDGWAYWPKPSRAAAKLIEVLEAKRRERFDGPDDITEAELRKLVSPIKAFLTRQGADHSVLEAPKPALSMPTIDQVINLWDVVQSAAPIMKGIDNGGTWGSFACREIEALADVFHAADRPDVADFILSEHAESDEEGDDHLHLVNPDK
ncbi:hypothetical protein SEA_RIZWANA_83 [Arthrobacter phage Rizwana]|nr:hypothetical protein SEA_RIZWANA_83 [Arthrobacter phage Rizwana]